MSNLYTTLRHISRAALINTVLLIAGLSSAHAANSLACGTYTRTDNHLALQVLSSNLMQQRMQQVSPDLFYYEIDNNTLTTFNLDLGGPGKYTLGAEGKTIIGEFGTVYTLTTPAACIAPIDLPHNRAWPACKNDRHACTFIYGEAQLDEMQALCKDGLNFVCRQLPGAHNRHEGRRPNASKNKALSDNALADLSASCIDNISAHTCEIAAKELWVAERYLDARAMMTHACAAPVNDNTACAFSQSLAPLSEALLAQTTAPAMPNGTYTATTGRMPTLIFDDEGYVTNENGSLKMTAYVNKGIIRLDGNGLFFEFLPVGTRYLLGRDYWNRLILFTRQGK